MTDASETTAKIDVCLKTSYKKCITISPKDMRVWELATAVLLLQTRWAWVCCAMNLIIAGTGTIFMSVLGDDKCSKTHFLIGFVQFCAYLTSIILLGIFGVIKMGGLVWIAWLWSAYWGYLIVKMTYVATEE